MALSCAHPVSAESAPVVLHIGTPVPLVTTTPLSSKTNVKGDVVPLRTADDVIIDGVIAIPKGTDATGQVVDARAKGAMGMSGKLLIRPLYLHVGNTVVRLAGQAADSASVSAGAVIGTVALGMAAFTGRSANIPAGTPLSAVVEKTVTLNR
jgi:hypothetical protein